MRCTTTLEYCTSTGIDSGIFRFQVYDIFLYIYVFYGILIIFEYQVFCYNRFRESRIDFHAP